MDSFNFFELAGDFFELGPIIFEFFGTYFGFDELFLL
jgi:hypothetical protein